MSIELGTELGEDGVTMRAIAGRLGVSATALYQHFESKSAIFREVRFIAVQALLAAQQPPQALDDPIASIHAWAVQYVEFAVENRWLYKVLFYEDELDWAQLHPEEQEHLSSPLLAVQSACERAQTSGAIDGAVDVADLALLLWASVHGFTSLLISGRLGIEDARSTGEREASIRSLVDGVLRSLRVPSGRASDGQAALGVIS